MDYTDQKQMQNYSNMHYASNRNERYSMAKWKLFEADALRLLEAEKCFYCHAPNGKPDEIGQGELKLTIDRIDPLGNYELGNVHPCCRQCNKSKHIQDLGQFVEVCTNVYNYTEFGIPSEKPIDWWNTYERKRLGLPCHASTFESYQRGAKDRNFDFEISRDDFMDITSQPCHYCRDVAVLGLIEWTLQ